MAALRRTAWRKAAERSAVPLIAIAFGVALAVAPISVHAETKERRTAAPPSASKQTVDNASYPVPVPGGPTPPIWPAQGPGPVLTPPATGLAPSPVPQIGLGPAPAPPPQPGGAPTPGLPRPTVLPAALATPPTPSPTRHMWVAQLIGESSETVALSRFRQMQRELRSALGSYEAVILRTTLKDGTIWVRVRVEFDARQAAETLCSKLEAARKHCLVQQNSDNGR
jgi:hypothetical protein